MSNMSSRRRSRGQAVAHTEDTSKPLVPVEKPIEVRAMLLLQYDIFFTVREAQDALTSSSGGGLVLPSTSTLAKFFKYRVRDTSQWSKETLAAVGIHCYVFGNVKGIIVQTVPEPGQRWGGPLGTRHEIGYAQKSGVGRRLILTAIHLRSLDLRKELRLKHEESIPQVEDIDEERLASQLLSDELLAEDHGGGGGGAEGAGAASGDAAMEGLLLPVHERMLRQLQHCSRHGHAFGSPALKGLASTPAVSTKSQEADALDSVPREKFAASVNTMLMENSFPLAEFVLGRELTNTETLSLVSAAHTRLDRMEHVRVLKELKAEQKGSVISLHFSPSRFTDGLASASDDGTVGVWDSTSGDLLLRLENVHTRSVQSVEFSPDGHFIATGSLDGTLCIWDVSTGGVLWQTQIDASVRSVSWHGSSRLLACASSDGVRIFQNLKRQRLPTPQREANPCVYESKQGGGADGVVFIDDSLYSYSGNSIKGITIVIDEDDDLVKVLQPMLVEFESKVISVKSAFAPAYKACSSCTTPRYNCSAAPDKSACLISHRTISEPDFHVPHRIHRRPSLLLRRHRRSSAFGP